VLAIDRAYMHLLVSPSLFSPTEAGECSSHHDISTPESGSSPPSEAYTLAPEPMISDFEESSSRGSIALSPRFASDADICFERPSKRHKTGPSLFTRYHPAGLQYAQESATLRKARSQVNIIAILCIQEVTVVLIFRALLLAWRNARWLRATTHLPLSKAMPFLAMCQQNQLHRFTHRDPSSKSFQAIRFRRLS